jgi:hypothetical protein
MRSLSGKGLPDCFGKARRKYRANEYYHDVADFKRKQTAVPKRSRERLFLVKENSP